MGFIENMLRQELSLKFKKKKKKKKKGKTKQKKKKILNYKKTKKSQISPHVNI